MKQQYFWTAASLADIVRRFKDLGKPWTEFPQCKSSVPQVDDGALHAIADVSIQLNDVSR